RQSVVSVPPEANPITPAERNREGVLARSPVRLRHADRSERGRCAEGGGQFSRMRRKRLREQARLERGEAVSLHQRPYARVRVYLRELVQAEYVNIVELQRHVRADFLGIADVELLRIWRFEARVN